MRNLPNEKIYLWEISSVCPVAPDWNCNVWRPSLVIVKWWLTSLVRACMGCGDPTKQQPWMAESTKHIRFLSNVIKAAMMDADIDLVLERKEDGVRPCNFLF